MALTIGERDQLKSAKIAVLKLINEHKDILFGKISSTLTRETKEAKWDEVADAAHTLGAFPWHRSWDYLKDTTWQNWRKRFMEKRDKKEKFGMGSKIIYDEADHLIMEILDGIKGKNSSAATSQSQSSQNYQFTSSTNGNGTHIRDISDVLEIEFDVKHEHADDTMDDAGNNFRTGSLNINGGESHGSSNNYMSVSDSELLHDLGNGFDENMSVAVYQTASSHHDENPSNYMRNGEVDEPSSIESLGQQPKIISTSSLSSNVSRASALRKMAFASLRSGASGGRKRPASFMSNISGVGANRSMERELTTLKCKKIRAELELMQRETYKKDLEILQLERSLGLPASHITKKFYKTAQNNHRGIN